MIRKKMQLPKIKQKKKNFSLSFSFLPGIIYAQEKEAHDTKKRAKEFYTPSYCPSKRILLLIQEHKVTAFSHYQPLEGSCLFTDNLRL